MSTNYYVRPRPGSGRADLPHDQDEDGVHLGKSAVGWAFMFRAYPDAEPPVADFASWLALLNLGGIYDEYGRERTREDLLALIEEKRDGRACVSRRDFRDAEGNVFIPEWFS